VTTIAEENGQAWAAAEFGEAMLGDRRRTRRLVTMAAAAAAKPSGKVTSVFCEGADREAAFRLLENDGVAPENIALAMHASTARRAAGAPFVLVPIDGSSLNLTDRTGEKGLGIVGARNKRAMGLCVMSAIAVAANGTPLGLCGQTFWARKQRSTRREEKHDRRKTEEKETRYWIEVMGHARTVFAEHAPGTRPWFQLDRGGDGWPLILDAVTHESTEYATIRASYNRRVRGGRTKQHYLWEQVERQPVASEYELDVPGSPNRMARKARLSVQFAPVRLDLRDQRSKRHFEAALHAVLVQELDTTPAGEKPIEWMLLTTYPVVTAEDALTVVWGYSQRWRIEEFHKLWKTGACNVEDTQLRADDHILRWATILASVAMRLLRLTYLARKTPDAPATVELSKSEVQAILLLRKPKSKPRGMPCISDAVRWLADLGGYTGKSSGGPPGAIVLTRGLRRIEPVAMLIAAGEIVRVKK